MSNNKEPFETPFKEADDHALSRRKMLLGTSTLVAAATLASPAFAQQAAPAAPMATGQPGRKPNILVIFGDDIGQTNVSAYSFGLMGYKTPNIDRIAREGMMFTDYYAEQSCTAGRSSFITGQCTLRTGLSKVGIPGATAGLQARDATIAELLKPLGYATGQFGKNHLGDRNEYLPTVHGSMSSMEIFITLMPRRTRRTAFIRATPLSGPRSVRAACYAARRRTATIPPSTPVSAKSVNRPSKTPARSPGSGWRRLVTRRRPPPLISCSVRRGRTRPSFAGSTQRGCTSAPMCGTPIVALRD
jgi:Sulfatase